MHIFTKIRTQLETTPPFGHLEHEWLKQKIKENKRCRLQKSWNKSIIELLLENERKWSEEREKMARLYQSQRKVENKSSIP